MEERARALARLAASFGLAWVAIALVAAPGPNAWVSLSGDAGDAGLFFAVFSLSSAAGAALGGRLMDAWGRRRALVAAHLLAAGGYATAGVGFAGDLLPLFVAGVVALALAVGTIALTRLAAGELFAPAQRARAVARVQVAATFGAVAGPLLLGLSDPVAAALGRSVDGVVWFLAPPLFAAAALLVARAPEPPPPEAPPAATGAPVAAAPPAPSRLPLAAGVVALVCAQAAMVTVMGVTGVALRHQGHGSQATGVVMALHFLGMFGLSLVVGRIADRAGRRTTILAGLGLMVAGGVATALVAGAVGLGLGLLLIGLGWSFSYIGGTVVLADVLPAARRARMLGIIDLSVALGAAAASFAGGAWYAARGMGGLGLVAVALLAVPLVLATILREPAPGRYADAAPPAPEPA